jgi:acyl transferase domain-containing protein
MTHGQLMRWLQERVAESLHYTPDEIKTDEPLEQYGLGSKENLLLSGDLEELLERELSPTLLWDYPTIQSLCTYLVEEKNTERDSVKHQALQESIAIIGIGCRFPGASSVKQFWDMLKNGENQVRLVPEGRWDKVDPSVDHVRFGGFLSELDQFDPAFFGISPHEAELMDPQQRLLLEVTWEAMEDAGIPAATLKGSNTAVYMGVSGQDYPDLLSDEHDFYYLTGNSSSIMANRISYWMDWYGPSMSINTACSSSLVAVDLACQNLRSGQSALAFVGGVNAMITPSNSIRFASGGVLALDGKCKTFDARADGYVRGEGAGVVVLKRLSQAVEDGDPIYAVIKGTAVNQDGRSNGLTAPNVHAQRALLQTASKVAGVNPADIFYVETHGTGTPLGDPIEVTALAEAYAAERDRPLYIGSVKTNIGHLEAAAGIAGLIKAALSLENRWIPPHLHFNQWNPDIPIKKYPLEVVTNGVKVPNQAYMGVSSFGFGGTNAHLILGQAPSRTAKKITRAKQEHLLLTLSARSNRSLHRTITQYRQHLEQSTSSFVQLATNAWFQRDHHEKRLSIIAKDRAEAIELLLKAENKEHDPNIFLKKIPKTDQVVFVFSGQGPRVASTASLLSREPAFRQTVEQIDTYVHDRLPISVLELLQHPSTSQKHSIIETQMQNFVIQVALANVWLSWGIKPSKVIGHSLGEVAAAHVAGALTLEDALEIVIQRSYCAEQMQNKGNMLVAQVDKQTAEKLLKTSAKKVAIAVYNSPTSHVFSGERAALDSIKQQLDQQHIFARLLATANYPSHSFYMKEIEQVLEEKLRMIQPQKAAIPFYSTVTGNVYDGQRLDAQYWCSNICKPVLFQDAVEALFQTEETMFLEISAHPSLLYAIEECADFFDRKVQAVPSLIRDHSAFSTLLASLGQLHSNGLSFDWDAVFGTQPTHYRIPNYAWDHQTCWIDSHTSRQIKSAKSTMVQRTKEPVSIAEQVKNRIGSILKIPVETLPLDTPIIDLGFDSILAIRLKNRLEQDLGMQISVVSILQGCTINDLVESLL